LGFENIKNEIEENIKKVKERQSKLKTLSETTSNSFNDLNYLLKNYKSEIEKLTKNKNEQSVPLKTTPSI
jgi:septal ring factor EnvC (AmiA/AmiB activator)